MNQSETTLRKDTVSRRYILMIVLPAFGALAAIAALVTGLILLSL